MWSKIKSKWLIYFLLAIVDVEANFFIVKAYSLTIVTTIQIIDAFVVPCTFLLAYILLQTRYRCNHVLSVALCLVGCACIVAGDYFTNTHSFLQHKLIGDLFCLLSSVLYAICNVGAEYLIKESTTVEYLAFFGFFGTLISILQMLALETEMLAKFFSILSPKNLLHSLLYKEILFFIYTLIPVAISHSSATFLNVNLLTSDFYTFLYGTLFKKYEVDYYFHSTSYIC